LELLLDPYILLGLTAIQPLLEAINALCVFAQQSDVFICDFVGALKVCEGQLYTMYVDRGTCFSKDDFWAFTSLLDCSHETIHLKWVADLNHSEEAQLAFVVGGEQHWAAHEWLPVSRTEFAQIITHLKTELRGKTLTNALFMFFFFFFFSHSLCAVGSWLLDFIFLSPAFAALSCAFAAVSYVPW
jgi:hypothetical protein